MLCYMKRSNESATGFMDTNKKNKETQKKKLKKTREFS